MLLWKFKQSTIIIFYVIYKREIKPYARYVDSEELAR